jgi:hypothetical protein
MPKSASSLKGQRVNVRMTPAMYANLKRLAGHERGVAEEIRKAVRAYLDDKAEITGSRRYCTGRFRDEVRGLHRLLSWYLSLIAIMQAEMFSILVVSALDLDAEQARGFAASSILKVAEERLIDSGWRVRLRVDAAIESAELEEQRQRDLKEG